ncbi:MAG: TetR/AcrR family transcriptional regulator [Spirochaetales bacterium]|jgi:AcrR family transcriptional regulator|nr:TetR/AcrR family transcriptional regulator [Spirochaetales bacterium]
MLQKANRAVERTKRWIFEALMALLDKKPYQEIGISDITEKAGVARTSFYRHYASKDDILIQYMSVNFTGIILTMKEYSRQGALETMTALFRFLQENSEVAEKLLRNDLEHILFSFVDSCEVFFLDLDIDKDSLSQEENLLFQYSIKYQFGGVFRMAMYWLKNHMPLPPEKMGAIANQFLIPFNEQNRGITDLLLRMKNLPPS